MSDDQAKTGEAEQAAATGEGKPAAAVDEGERAEPVNEDEHADPVNEGEQAEPVDDGESATAERTGVSDDQTETDEDEATAADEAEPVEDTPAAASGSAVTPDPLGPPRPDAPWAGTARAPASSAGPDDPASDLSDPIAGRPESQADETQASPDRPAALDKGEVAEAATPTPPTPPTPRSTLEDVEALPPSPRTTLEDTQVAPSTPAEKGGADPVSTEELTSEYDQAGRHPISAFARGAALLLGVGASVGLGVWELWHRAALTQYVKSNKIDAGSRTLLLVFVAVGVAVPLVSLLIYGWRRRKRLIAAAHSIEALGWTLSPLCLAGLVPLLFHWRLWKGNDLNFLVLAAVAGFCAQKLLYRSFIAPPVSAWRPRWWARLRGKLVHLRDTSSSWLPWAVVVGLFVFYAVYFSFYTIQNHWNLRTAAYDLAIEDNVVYNAMHGELLKASPMFGPKGTHLGHHATFFAFVLAPFYAISPQPETLLIIQAILIGAAVIPLFLFTRSRLGPWYAVTFAALYVLYAPVHGANLYDFHYPPLGIGFVFWMMFLVDTKRYKWAALALVLSLSVREDIALAVFVVGAYFILSNRRPKAGFIIAAIGIGYFVIMKMGVMPAVRGGKESFAWYYKDLVPPGGPKGFTGILATIAGNPGYTLSRLLQTEKVVYLLQIITPFAFLPWRRGIGFVFCLPGVLMTLLAHRSAAYQISFQYTAHWTIGLFLAVVVILTMTKKPAWPGDRRGGTRVASWMGALIFAMLATSYQHGAILQHNTARGGFTVFKFDRSQKEIDRYNALRSLIVMMPPEAKVASTERLLPHMSNRPNAYTVRSVGVRDAEYIIFPRRIGGSDLKRIHPHIKKGTFGIVAQAKDMYLAQRGYSTEKNKEALKRLRRPPKDKPKKRKRKAKRNRKRKTKLKLTPKPKPSVRPKLKGPRKPDPMPSAQPKPKGTTTPSP